MPNSVYDDLFACFCSAFVHACSIVRMDNIVSIDVSHMKTRAEKHAYIV